MKMNFNLLSLGCSAGFMLRFIEGQQSISIDKIRKYFISAGRFIDAYLMEGTYLLTVQKFLASTVFVKCLNTTPVLYCERPIYRVWVWPKWVGPAHFQMGQ